MKRVSPFAAAAEKKAAAAIKASQPPNPDVDDIEVWIDYYICCFLGNIEAVPACDKVLAQFHQDGKKVSQSVFNALVIAKNFDSKNIFYEELYKLGWEPGRVEIHEIGH